MTDHQPEFDRIIAALRSGANPAELAGEDAALEAMASTFASTPATVRSFGSARSLRGVAIVAASLVGMGGIAAAGAATLRPVRDSGEISTADTVVDTTIPETTVPETVADTTIPETTVSNCSPSRWTTIRRPKSTKHSVRKATTAQPSARSPRKPRPAQDTAPSSAKPPTDRAARTPTTTRRPKLLAEPLVDDPATEFDETQCAEGNHGATVSSIAKETPPGPGHGAVVREAAHSSCGKQATSDDTTDDTIADDSTDTTTVAATDDDSPGNSAGHGNSNGHGSGNGNSGGNGNGRGNGKPGG